MKSQSGPLKVATKDSDCSWARVTALMICPVAYGMRIPEVALIVSNTSIATYHPRNFAMKYITKRNGVGGSWGAPGARCTKSSMAGAIVAKRPALKDVVL